MPNDHSAELTRFDIEPAFFFDGEIAVSAQRPFGCTLQSAESSGIATPRRRDLPGVARSSQSCRAARMALTSQVARLLPWRPQLSLRVTGGALRCRAPEGRSDERRVGKECVRKLRTRWT